MRPIQLPRIVAVALVMIVALTGCSPSKTEIAAVEKSNVFERQVTELKTQNKDLDAKITSLTTELGAKTTRVAVLETKVEDLTGKLGSTEAQNKDLSQKLIDRDARITALESENAKAAEAAAKLAAEEASKANLTVQLGLTMKSGDTKPVSNTTVYLMTAALRTLVPATFDTDPIPGIDNYGTSKSTAAGVLHYPSLHRRSLPVVMEGIKKGTVATATTDFNGRAQFEGIPPGEYWILCATELGGGAALQRKVSVKGKSTFVALGNADVEDEFAN